MGSAAKPVDKSSLDRIAEGDNGNEDRPMNPPAAQNWSQSEIGAGSQGDPWSGPGKPGGKPSLAKNGPNGIRGQNPIKPAWGNNNGVGGAKDWSPSELGVGDSVSQRGDEGFRKAPTMAPGKKSWADQVEDGDEMSEYGAGDEPAAMVAPEPNLDSEDEDDEGWVKRGRAKGKGQGKAKSATGWSDVSKGPW